MDYKERGMKMNKLFRMFGFIALIGLLGLVGGGCSEICDPVDPEPPYSIINVPGAILPANPANWTVAEKLGKR
jgi:hypothetical protein